MRVLSRYSLAGCVLAAGCGGGGSAPATSGAALVGTIYEIDGQTLDRSGVRVAVPETGDHVMTPRDGDFEFRDLPPGTITLIFESPAAPAGGSSEQVDLERGRTVRLFVAMQDGEVIHMCKSDEDEEGAKVSLVVAEGSPLPDVEGAVEVESDDDGEEFEIEAEHLEPGTEVDFFLDNPGDADGFVLIGTVAADAEGDADLELKTEDGDVLPLGAASVADLVGFLIEVRLTATGDLLLTGEVPDVAAPDVDDDEDDDEDEEEDDDEDDDDEDEDEEEGDDDDEEDDD